ncbi:unnamed protein product [Lactuca virosa]|uniref:Zinc finger GRF-type domain-containing protein n=1 Tax=Lactuca virosa TaxID=75947 RepID=A0AAU9M0V6_9ASTR|nr:unnamed protein product [Lactuca virosa]
MEPSFELKRKHSYPKLGHPDTLYSIDITKAISASSGRSINLLRVENHRDDEACPPCDCKDGIGIERVVWMDDNIARRFWNCKNALVSIPSIYLHPIRYLELKMYTFSLIVTLIVVFPFNQLVEGPKCKFFLWKDDAMEEGYYKKKLRKLRFEVREKEDFCDVSKAQKKVTQLQ